MGGHLDKKSAVSTDTEHFDQVSPALLGSGELCTSWQWFGDPRSGVGSSSERSPAFLLTPHLWQHPLTWTLCQLPSSSFYNTWPSWKSQLCPPLSQHPPGPPRAPSSIRPSSTEVPGAGSSGIKNFQSQEFSGRDFSKSRDFSGRD